MLNDDAINKLRAGVHELEQDITHSNRLVLLLMLTLALLFLWIHSLFRWPMEDFFLSMSTGLISGAIVFWAVDVSFTKRTLEFNSRRDLLILSTDIERDNQFMAGFSKRLTSLSEIQEIMMRQLDLASTDNQRIEILQHLLELNDMFLSLNDEMETTVKLSAPKEDRVIAGLPLTSPVALELLQKLQQGALIRERQLQTLREGREVMKESREMYNYELQKIRFRQQQDTNSTQDQDLTSDE